MIIDDVPADDDASQVGLDVRGVTEDRVRQLLKQVFKTETEKYTSTTKDEYHTNGKVLKVEAPFEDLDEEVMEDSTDRIVLHLPQVLFGTYRVLSDFF